MADATLQAGRELDALVAEKVMGLAPEQWPFVCEVDKHDTAGDVWCSDCQEETDKTARVPLHYSTDISAAWQVVERLHEKGYALTLHNEPDEDAGYTWGASVGGDSADAFVESWEDTAPMAICTAALRTVTQFSVQRAPSTAEPESR